MSEMKDVGSLPEPRYLVLTDLVGQYVRVEEQVFSVQAVVVNTSVDPPEVRVKLA